MNTLLLSSDKNDQPQGQRISEKFQEHVTSPSWEEGKEQEQVGKEMECGRGIILGNSNNSEGKEKNAFIRNTL